MELKLTGYQLTLVASHHCYIEVVCPLCVQTRTTRKDLVAKKLKLNEQLLCKSCALKTRKVTWKKDPSELKRNQGAYKSYVRAKRRVQTNHKNAYSKVKFLFDSYEQFLNELGPRPEGMTLDRIDNSGDYAPGNVRWASIEQQARNRNPRYTWTPKPSTSEEPEPST